MIKIGDNVKILATSNDFLIDSIGMIGVVVGINNDDEDCLVEFPIGFGCMSDNQWFYSWGALEVIK